MGTRPDDGYMDCCVEIDGLIQVSSLLSDTPETEGTISRDCIELAVRELAIEAIDGADLKLLPALIWACAVLPGGMLGTPKQRGGLARMGVTLGSHSFAKGLSSTRKVSRWPRRHNQDGKDTSRFRRAEEAISESYRLL